MGEEETPTQPGGELSTIEVALIPTYNHMHGYTHTTKILGYTHTWLHTHTHTWLHTHTYVVTHTHTHTTKNPHTPVSIVELSQRYFVTDEHVLEVFMIE